MAEYETEEEQIDAIKNWWKENGRSVVAGAVIGIAGLVGWKGWDAYHEQQALAASDRYNALRASVLSQDLEAVVQQADELKENYPGTPYSALGALLLAKAKAEQGNTDAVIENLQWVINNGKQATVQSIARVRLARMYIAQNSLEQAQALLDEEYPQSFQSLLSELRGDLYVRKGDKQAARGAYDEAIAAAGSEDVEFLRIKRDSLGIIGES